MELRHLRYFLAVVDEGNVTKAAARLGIAQPPLSRQLRALEDELDAPLFFRESRGVTLTEAGRALEPEARTVLALVDRLSETVRRTAHGERGTLAIGFTISAPFNPLVPRVIRAFREQAPAVAIAFAEENGLAELVAALREERLDVAFVRGPFSCDDLTVDALLREEMIVALPAGHALAGGKRGRSNAALALRELANEPFILYRRRSGGSTMYDGIVAACRRAGFNPNVVQEAPMVVSTLNLVAAGLGVSIVPASLRQQQSEGVVYVRIADADPPTAPLYAIYRRTRVSPALARFIELLRAHQHAP
jgi:DNA-binding transcriptional LysR family regulator